ncbi:MAG: DUF3244 domain-containing protein [Paludibacteraceae bacterium]|nr:DUF3244 domain-containing protein [Paludibacteraceae bacterium]
MKKVIVIALFILGIFNAPVFGMSQEIILSELYSIVPLDDAKDEGGCVRPNPTRFHASIDGNHLSVGADTGAPAYVEVINQETGEVVVEEEFLNETEATITQAGSYVVQIYSANTVVTGEFEVE